MRDNLDLLEQIRGDGHLVAAPPLGLELPDPDDELFLEVALAASAAYLVTGNLKHYPPRRRRGARVASPRELVSAI